MAQQINVRFVDDLDGTDAADTVTFGLDGKVYEIDLSEANAARLRGTFADFVAAARRTGGRTRRGAAIHAPSDRAQTAAVRTWARKNGWPDLSGFGRIPHDILDAYQRRAGR